ncbi:unnamed protein product [Ilex paraguariensis]|uniref:Uncharacterized protein n=1 Tax=Ilex paraguariensis TaxID=185542 RepID=A0ABC8SZ85_9AQUA
MGAVAPMPNPPLLATCNHWMGRTQNWKSNKLWRRRRNWETYLPRTTSRRGMWQQEAKKKAAVGRRQTPWRSLWTDWVAATGNGALEMELWLGSSKFDGWKQQIFWE